MDQHPGGPLGSLAAGQQVRRGRQPAARGRREPVHETQRGGRLGPPVAAEGLVRALSGQDDLDRAGGEPAQLEQAGAEGLPHGSSRCATALATLAGKSTSAMLTT